MRRTPLGARAIVILLLLADLAIVAPAEPGLVPAPDVAAAASPPEGVSGADVARVLDALADDRFGVADVAPLAGVPSVDLPAVLLAPVVAPPPLADTLRALARLHPEAAAEALLPTVPALPADLDAALSSLGQAVVGAEALVANGDALAAAALVETALARATPSLRKHAALLGHAEAFEATATSPRATRPLLDGLASARSADDVWLALGVPAVEEPARLPLSRALAGLYATLGLPVDARARAGLAAADGLDASVRAPLERALAHTLAATELRDAAFAKATPADLALLARAPDVMRVAAGPAAAEADLDLLHDYGDAVERVDRGALLRALAHLLAAERILADGLTAPASTHPPAGGGVTIGNLTLESAGDADGGWILRMGPDPEAPTVQLARGRVAHDAPRLALTVFDDRDGDGAPDADEVLFATPPLADPARDVLFRDPYGLVVVTGDGRTASSAGLGGAPVRLARDVALPDAAPVNATAATALDALDAALSPDPTAGAWPWWSAEARAVVASANATSASAPEHVTLVVNPASHHVLRWDLGGPDGHDTNAGGAGAAGLVAVRADRAGAALAPNATATPLPVALLVDLGGDDVYATRGADTLAAANASLALVVDVEGDDAYRNAHPWGGAASAATAGVAALLDLAGNDTFATGNRSAAYASGPSVALLLDAGGTDARGARDDALAHAAGGVALLLDLAGADAYSGANASLAASRAGVALLLDADGGDSYASKVDATSRGFVAPASPSALPCLAAGACAPALGPARLAALLDLAGSDTRACPRGRAWNAALGSVGVEHWPVGGFDPAIGLCADVDAAPNAAAVTGPHGPSAQNATKLGARVPATYFTSSYGNFTFPGLLHLGTLGNDTVREHHLLAVDVLGNETWTRGALAVANATRAAELAADLGFVGPVSVLVDVDGNDAFDANATGVGRAPGAFGYADGGVAVHATLRARDEIARYRNVTVGLASAENGGVALVVARGTTNRVDAPVATDAAASTCRLACARRGGVAIVTASGGAGDVVAATPGSLGAVEVGPLGGVALWHRRDGVATFTGSNESMGVLVRPDPAAVAERPVVSLFVKDGHANDSYAPSMRWTGLARMPRLNERQWTETDPLAGVADRRLVVAMGVDNLDWYADSRLATAADRGVAENVGPGVDPRATYHKARGLHGAFQQLPSRFPDQVGARYWYYAPGNANTLTGPEGVRPVSLALTPFTPIVNVTLMGNLTGADHTLKAPDRWTAIGGNWRLIANVTDPPGYADETVDEASPTTPRTGRSIVRVELTVEGTSNVWRGCPVANLTDDLNPNACVAASWDVTRDPAGGSSTVVRRNAVQWQLNFTTALFQPGSLNQRIFPPGPYLVSVRAFAGRAEGVRLAPEPARPASAEASNALDDDYGLYGAAYHVAVPLSNPPVIYEPPAIVDKNATRDLELRGFTPEPVEYHVEYVPWVKRGSTIVEDPTKKFRHPATGKLRSDRWGQLEAYAALGYDTILYEWDGLKPNGQPADEGKYTATFVLTGNVTKRTNSVSQRVFIDHQAVPIGVDPRGPPDFARVTALSATNGVFNLSVGFDPDAGLTTAPFRRVHLWAEQDVLDPVDPSRVIAHYPWRYVGNTTANEGYPFVLPNGTNHTVTLTKFAADPTPGPARVIRVAAYVEDRAGNVRVPNPETATPSKEDCIFPETFEETCAVFLYDVTRPRTSAKLLDPSTDLSATRGAPIRVRVDTSQTPDVAALHLLVALTNATAKNPPAIANYTVPENLTYEGDGIFSWRPNATALVHGGAVHLASRAVDRVGNVEIVDTFDARVEIDLVPPALGALPVVAAGSGNATIVWNTTEPSRGAVVVHNETGAVVATVASDASAGVGGLLREHEVLVTGLRPDAAYNVTLRIEDAVGNAVNVSRTAGAPVEFRTARGLDVVLDPMPPIVAGAAEARWRATRADDPLVTYQVALSLDGGLTFPVDLTPGGRPVFEAGDTNRTALIDARTLPESARARVRVEAWPTATPDVRAVVLSPVFTLDGLAPRTTAAATAGLTTYTNGSSTVTFAAVDAGSGVARVEWSLDGSTWRAVTGPVTFAEPDAVTLRYRARDVAGNVEDARELRLLLDARPPSLLASVRGGSVTRDSHAPVVLEATDAGAGDAGATLRDDTGAEFDLPATAFVGGRALILWPLGPREGERTLRAVVEDGAGNSAAALARAVVDRGAPRAAVRTVAVAYTWMEIEIAADEPVRLAGTLRTAAGTRELAPLDATRHVQRLRVDGLAPGVRHDFALTLADAAGNEARVRFAAETADDAAPPSRPGPVRVEPLRDGSLVLRWTPSTDNAGVVGYVVRREGGSASVETRVAGTQHVDATTEPGRAYEYRVAALDLGGNEGEDASTGATSRTAPVVLATTVDVARTTSTGDVVRVVARVEDRDGDEIGARVVLPAGNVTLTARRETSSEWSLAAEMEIPHARLGVDDRRLHVLVTDGLFNARDPPAGEFRAPPAVAPEEALGIAGLLRVVPATPTMLVAALALVLALARRSGR